MIYLTKGQKLADNPTLVVYDQTGYYNDGDSIICAPAAMPDEPAVRYEAKFVAYGGMVYSISDPDELLAEIIKIDPKSLYGKDSQQVAVDKVIENIVPQAEGVVPVEGTEVLEEAEVPAQNETATTTPPIIPPPATTSTTTPAVSTTTPSTAATTTPSTTSTTTPSTNTGTATTTPQFNLSTTTPPIITVPEVNQPTTTTPPDVLFPDAVVSTTTPIILDPDVDEGTSNNNATSSDTTTVIDNNSDDIIPPPLPETQEDTNTSTTTEEVVAFAKKLVKNKISKSLGL